MNEKIYLRAFVNENTGELDALFYLELKEDETESGVFAWWAEFRGYRPLNTMMRANSLDEAKRLVLRLWGGVGWSIDFLD